MWQRDVRAVNNSHMNKVCMRGGRYYLLNLGESQYQLSANPNLFTYAAIYIYRYLAQFKNELLKYIEYI